MAGGAEPTWERKQPWLDRLAREKEIGIHNHRVHILARPLTDYLRYECEWGYVHNSAAGEDIRILDLTGRDRPKGIVDHDFWLIDDEHAIRMFYDAGGHFLGAEPAPDMLQAYQHSAAIAVDLAQPFQSWWAAQAEEWRENRAA